MVWSRTKVGGESFLYLNGPLLRLVIRQTTSGQEVASSSQTGSRLSRVKEKTWNKIGPRVSERGTVLGRFSFNK